MRVLCLRNAHLTFVPTGMRRSCDIFDSEVEKADGSGGGLSHRAEGRGLSHAAGYKRELKDSEAYQQVDRV